MATIRDKPTLILVAVGIRSGAGSEPGKGWGWANALARFYDLEILTKRDEARYMENHGVPSGWRVHGVEGEFAPGPAWQYYPAYQRWCTRVLTHCQDLIRTQPIVGLHHITLGSFRVLPRYDRLGVPYTLGPLGGGESIPWKLLPQLRLPVREVLTEATRLPVNYAFALLPNLRAVFSQAHLTLATTAETLHVVTRIGARRTAVVFPDALDLGGSDDAAVLHRRGEQAAGLRGQFRCVCAGRALWWKGMHLAIDFIHRLRGQGINAKLDIFSQGKALTAWRERAAALGVAQHVTFHPMIRRDDLIKHYEQCHLFLYPTMHDSSSAALVEAYSTGLPSMTLGLAGSAMVVTSQTGLNSRVRNVADWLEQGRRMISAWIEEPSDWLSACRAARSRANDFGASYLEQCVREHLQPVFSRLPPGGL